MADRIQHRRDTKANWEQYNPVLLEGEIGVVMDDPNLYKVGDGTNAWNDLPFRGFDGTIVHKLGNSENAVMSQNGLRLLLNEKYLYRSVAVTSTIPNEVPNDMKVFYLASDPGIYSNFLNREGDPIKIEAGEFVAIISSKGGDYWGKQILERKLHTTGKSETYAITQNTSFKDSQNILSFSERGVSEYVFTVKKESSVYIPVSLLKDEEYIFSINTPNPHFSIYAEYPSEEKDIMNYSQGIEKSVYPKDNISSLRLYFGSLSTDGDEFHFSITKKKKNTFGLFFDNRESQVDLPTATGWISYNGKANDSAEGNYIRTSVSKKTRCLN